MENYKKFFDRFCFEGRIDDYDYFDSSERLIEFAKAVVKANSKYLYQNNRSRCAFCYKTLSHEDHQFLAPEHIHSTCKEHNQFAGYFQIRLVQKQLGLPTDDPEYKGFFD